MAGEKRRSDRIWVSIPLLVEGADADGVEFKENTCTVSLNRHGARIRLTHAVRTGQTLQLLNQMTHRQADFRVVGPASPPTASQPGEWGVECVKLDKNIWGIQFPPIPEGEEPEVLALLECRKCHTVAALRLTLVEVEVLETAGILSKPCETCRVASPWERAERDALTSPGAQAEVSEAPTELSFRKHRRVALQLPVMIRRHSGEVEVTKCENMSKGGLAFVSEKDYGVGEEVFVACPYDAKGESFEVGAQIVRREPVEGSNLKIYGVCYASSTA